MKATETKFERPKRWDRPFDPTVTDADVEALLHLPLIDQADPAVFPKTLPLHQILRNDTRRTLYRHGDIIVRQGDYGHSAFLIVYGRVRVVHGLPAAMLGHKEPERKGLFQVLGQLWRNRTVPELRDPVRYGQWQGVSTRFDRASATVRVALNDIPEVLRRHDTQTIGPGELFGELAALTRMPRNATVFADGDAEVLEMRWQGLRDIRKFTEQWRRYIDAIYRERALIGLLRAMPMFRHLDETKLRGIAQETLFETYGSFEWYREYQQAARQGGAVAREPVIAREGRFADDLVLIRAGFARVTEQFNHGHRTVTVLQQGSAFGFQEIAQNWRRHAEPGLAHAPLQHTLRSVGYTDVLRVPARIVEQQVLPTFPRAALPPLLGEEPAPAGAGAGRALGGGILELLTEHRFVNGRATMVIDLNRCVGCDDCVRACAAAHGNNPRFLRHGQRVGHFMVANACMHCTDPVCMIGCPTGAIHRDAAGGQVVINDLTCIGCRACAESCPYDNIRMVEVRDGKGRPILDASDRPIVKATKCDLCVDQIVAPACEQACPHDALVRLDMSDFAAVGDWFGR